MLCTTSLIGNKIDMRSRITYPAQTLTLCPRLYRSQHEPAVEVQQRILHQREYQPD